MPGIRLGSHIPRTVLDVQRRICGGLPLQLAHKPVAASLTGKSCSRGLLPLVWPREIILNFPLLLYPLSVAGTERGIDRDTEYVLSLKPLD